MSEVNYCSLCGREAGYFKMAGCGREDPERSGFELNCPLRTLNLASAACAYCGHSPTAIFIGTSCGCLCHTTAGGIRT